MKHERNIEGLRASARSKAEITRRRAEEAITQLVTDQRPINFHSMAQAASVSTAWLYADEQIRQRIMFLRSQQTPRSQVAVPQREQASDASKDMIIAALRKRIKELDGENRALKRQIEVAYGLLAGQTPTGDR